MSTTTTTTNVRRPTVVTTWVVARRAELVAAGAFVAMCAAVLARGTALLEPDDYAYRASIAALAEGRITLTTAQYQALATRLGGIAQWVHLANGSWISQKNPGYPFFAVLFDLVGALRLAPLFFGALACVALFAGARRWLGGWGGAYAVVLFCSSGAALAFAWRATMPTFTDAALIAAGAGSLLWALLATEASTRRRRVVGLAAFLALEGAVFIRYTDVVALIVGVAVALVAPRITDLRWRDVAPWIASVVVFAAGDLAFNAYFYGGPLRTGYGSADITFTWSALVPNLRLMPGPLVVAMPMSLIAAASVAAVLVRAGRRSPASVARADARRDLAVAVPLLAVWTGVWGLYLLYAWTEQVGLRGGSIHVIRFYVPAIGVIALLGAWGLARLPRHLPVVALVVVVLVGALNYQSLVSSAAPGRGGPPAGIVPGGPSGAPSGGVPPGPPPGSGPGLATGAM